MNWGYGHENGPKTWVKNYCLAEGKQQSPINIVTAGAKVDASLTPITIAYHPEQNMELKNTGHSVMAQITTPSIISGGPLKKDTYQLEQFHLHWGSDKGKGSEHTINKQEYDSELHLVHWNRKYENFAKAADKPDGLAVFGIFLNVGKEHKEFKVVTDYFESVKFTAKHVEVKGQFNPQCLLPGNVTEYWTYPGSLTTPPCYESVTWIVFREVMTVSESQMKSLRSLCRGCDTDHIANNYRPPCPTGDRPVRASFQFTAQ